MQTQITRVPPSAHHPQDIQRRSWLAAYGKFLVSPQESLILKIAPLAFLIGAPELVASEFIPIFGELTGLGAIVIAVLVAVRTIGAVRRYR